MYKLQQEETNIIKACGLHLVLSVRAKFYQTYIIVYSICQTTIKEQAVPKLFVHLHRDKINVSLLVFLLMWQILVNKLKTVLTKFLFMTAIFKLHFISAWLTDSPVSISTNKEEKTWGFQIWENSRRRLIFNGKSSSNSILTLSSHFLIDLEEGFESFIVPGTVIWWSDSVKIIIFLVLKNFQNHFRPKNS